MKKTIILILILISIFIVGCECSQPIVYNNCTCENETIIQGNNCQNYNFTIEGCHNQSYIVNVKGCDGSYRYEYIYGHGCNISEILLENITVTGDYKIEIIDEVKE